MPSEHVLIVVPSLTHTVSAAVMHLAAASQRFNIPRRFTVRTLAGLKGYDFVRNCAVQSFMAGDYDRLWMIDDDIMPTEDVFALLDVDADIVAPLMPTLKWDMGENTFNFHVAYAAGRYSDINDLSTAVDIDISGGGVVDVDMVGTGCTIIRREVLEDPRMCYDASDLEDDEPRPIFRYHRKSNGAHKRGEDEDFCVRAKLLGYSVKLHTGIETGHRDQIDIAHVMKMRRHYEALASHNPVAEAI